MYGYVNFTTSISNAIVVLQVSRMVYPCRVCDGTARWQLLCTPWLSKHRLYLHCRHGNEL